MFEKTVLPPDLAWQASNHIKSQTFLRRIFLKICLLILSTTPPSAACRFGHRVPLRVVAGAQSRPGSAQCCRHCGRGRVPQGCLGFPSGTQNKVLINMWAGPCAAGVSGTTSGMDEDNVLINMWKQNLESGEELGSQAGPLQRQDRAAHLPYQVRPVPHGCLLSRGFHYRLH